MQSSLITQFNKTHPLQKLSIEDKAWEYIVCGKGKETIVLFPGGAQTAQGNFRLIQALEKDYKVLIVSILDVDSIETFCSAINTILTKENIKTFHLYGLSIGGMMALAYTKRNQDKVTSLILSHSCAPSSMSYVRKIKPLLRFRFLLPIASDRFIKYFGRTFMGRLQGETKQTEILFAADEENINQLTMFFHKEFLETYLTKRIVMTWAALHHDFFNETITIKDFVSWHGDVLILQSDNDPLVHDGGELKKIFPKAKEYLFHGTGHLAYYYQFSKMSEVMMQFLKSK